MDILNFDLLWVGIAVTGAGTLGTTIFFSQPKSATARAFLFFSIVSILWSIANFASARATDPVQVLWFIRIVIFFATWHAFSFLLLAQQFPSEAFTFPRKRFLALLAWSATISLVALTPFVYQSVTIISGTVVTQTGPGISLFGLTVFGYVGTALWLFIRRYRSTSGPARRQMEAVLSGVVITFIFLITFDFFFPAFLNNPSLVPYGGLFLLPFIFGTGYAILQYRLFNSRVAFFGLLTFMLATATFFDVLLSDSLALVLYRTGELALVLFAGVWLIRSMVHEFELEHELADTNERQEGLIRFISHEVKNFLTKDMYAFTALADGDFGVLQPDTKTFVVRAQGESQNSIASVMDILKASNQKKGTVDYRKDAVDLKQLAEAAVAKEESDAKAKGLAITFNVESGTYALLGDATELQDHVLGNLIENAIHYTPSGNIVVTLKRDGDKAVFAVKDTGVGITAEDKSRLFTEGGHGKESQKLNVHSTGYGLYIAKNIVTAHGGAIRAESGGRGRGSTFIVELPVSA